ncbi:6-carboxytetrahydropterin synthase QueD [Fictibacillus sp. Mic-4]|uniref:6-carboxytetrahydropterin synthase QueD n=1 Tax=Fictibacillus TaxID=1329200 RepID=UPI00041DEA5A|nr:6-carboxytetrahydropterin synthase QueD [Fictibacillus gelatini]
MNFEIPKKVQQLGQDIRRNELKYHRKRVAVTKEFTFDAAHHLHCYEGKCKSLHGHTYKLIITISGFVDERGLVIDFTDVKRIYKEVIESRLDHRYLNEVLPKMNTTAENMIVWMWEELDRKLAEEGLDKTGLRLEELVLYETPTSYATLKREWMEENES